MPQEVWMAHDHMAHHWEDSVTRCCVCGRFVKWNADSSTYFGGATDLEPPDPLFYCHRCAKREEQLTVVRGYVCNCHWIKPDWERRAAKSLGYVECQVKGAAWTVWYPGNAIPPGYQVVR